MLGLAFVEETKYREFGFRVNVHGKDKFVVKLVRKRPQYGIVFRPVHGTSLTRHRLNSPGLTRQA